MTVSVYGSREARANWRDLLDKALAGDGDVIIERSGRPVAAVISYADYLALADELDDLQLRERGSQPFKRGRFRAFAAGCIQRFDHLAYSGASRTLIPIQVGQVFRFKSDTDSGEVGHPGRRG